MAKQNKYKKGQWNAICDVCGFKKKAEDLRLRWDGFWVCPEDWEPRHPQDFLRTPKDDQSVAWTRPESTDQFTDPVCSAEGRTDQADIGEADCMTLGIVTSTDNTIPSGTNDGSL